jgi:hypothetical protein
MIIGGFGLFEGGERSLLVELVRDGWMDGWIGEEGILPGTQTEIRGPAPVALPG